MEEINWTKRLCPLSKYSGKTTECDGRRCMYWSNVSVPQNCGLKIQMEYDLITSYRELEEMGKVDELTTKVDKRLKDVFTYG